MNATLQSFARFLALFMLLPGVGLPSALAASPPNILFLFADDLTHEGIRALGNREVETPHLDRLARKGVAFTRAYNMGSWSGAVCIASRTMLNTGRFVWHAEKVDATCEQERQAGRFWSEYMRRAGYETYMTGKWHVKADAAKAFDHAADIRPGMPAQTPQGYDRPLPGQPDPWSPSDPSLGGFWQGGRHWSEVVADHATSFLHHAAGSEKPFFMYIAFNAAHDPRQSPQSFVDTYPPERVKVPENYLDEYPYKDGIGCGKGLRDERLAPFPRTPQAVRVHRGEYYAIISHMDQQIGRILDQLEATGQADRTWIFFTADHGLAVGHHGLFGKQNMYEHSVRVPFVVCGPGVAAGRRIEAPIYLQDIMPTTLELAGVDKPGHVEFHSLLPLIRGETQRSLYDAVYGAYLGLQRMVMQDGYKLILYPKIGRARLYHVEADPEEMKDLAGEPGEKGRMKALFARLLALQKATEDTLDLRAAFPALAE